MHDSPARRAAMPDDALLSLMLHKQWADRELLDTARRLPWLARWTIGRIIAAIVRHFHAVDWNLGPPPRACRASPSPRSPMNRILSLLLVPVALTLGPGCKSTRDAPKPSTTTAPAAHAASSARPGSYDDWCGEHQVPESLCTRCNPQLSSAFKATNDWCEEHGLPESQCLKCNPGLRIVRPAKTPGG